MPFDSFKIYRTTDYSAFSRLAENRDMREAHVQALMQSFENDGYLFTIVYVNEKVEIIDGQHRFESAKRKHLPVFFIVMPGWGIREVSILNVNSLNWTMEDFMNTHARSGNQNYVRFKEFFDANPFDITTCQLILFGRRSKAGGNADWFRSGEMKLEKSDLERGFSKSRKILEFKDFHPHGFKTRNFVEALLKLLNTKGYVHRHMIEQLKRYPVSLLFEARSLRVAEYLKMLVEKFNYRRKDKLDLD